MVFKGYIYLKNNNLTSPYIKVWAYTQIKQHENKAHILLQLQ